jgi:hypothetical protein
VVVIDEASILFGARSSMTKENKAMIEELFLIGKKNVDLIWCVQLDRSLDGYARDLS